MITPDDLLEGLESDNLFWRTAAQRLIVENSKKELIPELINLAKKEIQSNTENINTTAIHALWTLKGLGAIDGSNKQTNDLVIKALSSKSYGLKKAAIALLPESRVDCMCSSPFTVVLLTSHFCFVPKPDLGALNFSKPKVSRLTSRISAY